MSQPIPSVETLTPRPNVPRWLGLFGLTGLTLLTRILFASQVLYHWDSVNFAYAVQEFNLAKEQPQPPGYILYVWLCQLLDHLVHDPQTVMVGISIVASVGAVLGMFWLGEAMYNRRVGWIGALFLAASPLFWFYNEIALPHTLDAFLVILSAWFLYRAMQGERRIIFPAVLVLVVAGGVRQQTLIFLLPLVLFSFRKLGWKTFLLAGLAGAALCLAWFIPLVTLSGGLQTYLAVMRSFSDRFQATTSVFMGAGLWGIRRNVTKLLLYTAYGWGIFFIPILVFAVDSRRRRGSLKPRERSIFISLWVLPAVLFYAFIHMGQQGLIFVFLPALILVGAAALEAAFSEKRGVLVVSTALLTVASGLVFLAVPEYPLGPQSQRLLTRQTLENSDRYFATRFEVIATQFDPQKTLILASNWHHVQYYLPAYQVVPFNLGAKWEVDEGAPVNNPVSTEEGGPAAWGLQPEDSQIVVFDPNLLPYGQEDASIETLSLAGGETLAVIDFPVNDVFYVAADSFGVKDSK